MKIMKQIQIKRIRDNAVIPTRGSASSAGLDLYAAIDYTIEIEPHTTVPIGTGLSIALPEGTFGAIFARSGLATKQGLRPANCVGVCDSDYRGEYIVPLHNDSENVVSVEPGQRIAQLIIQEYVPTEIIEVKKLDKTERGENGFGSTGR